MEDHIINVVSELTTMLVELDKPNYDSFFIFSVSVYFFLVGLLDGLRVCSLYRRHLCLNHYLQKTLLLCCSQSLVMAFYTVDRSLKTHLTKYSQLVHSAIFALISFYSDLLLFYRHFLFTVTRCANCQVFYSDNLRLVIFADSYQFSGTDWRLAVSRLWIFLQACNRKQQLRPRWCNLANSTIHTHRIWSWPVRSIIGKHDVIHKP